MGGVTAMQGRPVVAGSAPGEALAADVPLSFWGGFDPDTGIVIDRRHPADRSIRDRPVSWSSPQVGVHARGAACSWKRSQRHGSSGHHYLPPRSGHRSRLHPRRRALRIVTRR